MQVCMSCAFVFYCILFLAWCGRWRRVGCGGSCGGVRGGMAIGWTVHDLYHVCFKGLEVEEEGFGVLGAGS